MTPDLTRPRGGYPRQLLDGDLLGMVEMAARSVRLFGPSAHGLGALAESELRCRHRLGDGFDVDEALRRARLAGRGLLPVGVTVSPHL